MYDFYFGTREEIARDEIRFLVAIKRMMPRWVNSLPDSEFIALAKLLDEQGREACSNKRKFVAIETGAGASTLAFMFYALKYEGTSFTWDHNGPKGSLLRSIATETMGPYFRRAIDESWRFVAFSSLSPYLGLPIAGEMTDHVDLFFQDSEHTWDTVRGEISALIPLMRDGAVVAMDDANQDYLQTNMGYINTFRRKLGLGPVAGPPENKVEPFFVLVERLLKERFLKVDYLHDLYKEKYATDPYFAYFNAEFDIKAGFGTERTEKLDHRFDSWRVFKPRGGIRA